jgi:hypothetical protein
MKELNVKYAHLAKTHTILTDLCMMNGVLEAPKRKQVAV